jgi:hypothetical protein
MINFVLIWWPSWITDQHKNEDIAQDHALNNLAKICFLMFRGLTEDIKNIFSHKVLSQDFVILWQSSWVSNQHWEADIWYIIGSRMEWTSHKIQRIIQVTFLQRSIPVGSDGLWRKNQMWKENRHRW